MFAVFSLSASIYGRHATERSSKYFDLVERKMRCVSEPRTATDRMHNVNDLCVMVALGHILIIHGLISSYQTPLTQEVGRGGSHPPTCPYGWIKHAKVPCLEW